jgi:hypothetical protein
MIAEGSKLWNYLSADQRVLAGDGAFLLAELAVHHDSEPTDYSYLVFPFAKLYEGFLKQLFLDTGIISQNEYESEHYRIGKALSPHLMGRLRRKSAYGQIQTRYGKGLATRLWHTWKNGRNMVFHYFPRNYRALTSEQAQCAIQGIVDAMNEAIDVTGVHPRKREDD